MDTMTKGYWIVSIDITDAEKFPAYSAANVAAREKYGAKFLAKAGRHMVTEGQAYSRNTIVEFESYDLAVACYQSPEYQTALDLRRDAAVANFVIVEGVEP